MIYIKQTGVARRIDELGRIVIPKELRESLRIKEGDSLDIFTHSNNIVLAKRSKLEPLDDIIKRYAKSIYKVLNLDMIICDNYKIIEVTGRVKESIIGLNIDLRLENRLYKRQMQIFDKKDEFEVCDNVVLRENIILKPIFYYGDLVGGMIIICDGLITSETKNLIEITTAFLTTYLEN